MIVDPTIAALRSDNASQRLLRDQMDRAHSGWQCDRYNASVLDDLVRYGEGISLVELVTLGALMTSLVQARRFVDHWCSAFTDILKNNQLGQVPCRHHYADSFANMQIASASGAALSLSVYEEKAESVEPRSAVFAEREMHEIVLFGEGEAWVFGLPEEGGGTEISSRNVAMKPAATLTTRGNTQSRQIQRVSGRMVVLQLSRVPQCPGLTRELALDSGQLLTQSSGDKHASQQEMAIAMLSALDRADAAPVLAELTRDGPDHLRWEALRHALALDFEAGWDALNQLAREKDDPLFTQAVQLRAHLLSIYPQLKQREAA